MFPRLQLVIQFVPPNFINFILLTSPVAQLWVRSHKLTVKITSSSSFWGTENASLNASVNNMTRSWRPWCKNTLPLCHSTHPSRRYPYFHLYKWLMQQLWQRSRKLHSTRKKVWYLQWMRKRVVAWSSDLTFHQTQEPRWRMQIFGRLESHLFAWRYMHVCLWLHTHIYSLAENV